MSKCILEKYNFHSPNHILKSLSTRFGLSTDSTAYRNIKAFLEECQFKMREMKDCLIRNRKRFGLKKGIQLDPTLNLNFELVDFLDPKANTTRCQQTYNSLLAEPKDVFVSSNLTFLCENKSRFHKKV